MTPQTAFIVLLVSASVATIFARPGLWGVGGAAFYATGQLSAVLFSEEASSEQTRRKAWVQWVMSIFFGLIAAEGFGPTLADMTHGHVRPEAVWLGVGLMANTAWPLIERHILRRIRDVREDPK